MTQTADLTFPRGSVFEGRYEILAELGSGSYGQVFKARQLSTSQLVAVKVLKTARHGAVDDLQNRIHRFRRETRLCAELSHPNIVRLIDSGEASDGRLYAAFEFVPGATLKDIVAAEGKLGVAEAVHLMTQVLDALSCAHARGVVHRDLKPENIMIAKTGARRNALVLDFGLGGFTSGGEAWTLPRITATHELLGTPCYAAPEQLRGEPPSPYSDLYSWGLILVECLTGDMPVHGASAQEVVLKQLGPDPVAIPKWLRNHPLGPVIELVTAKRAERRNDPIERLLEMLAMFGAGQPAEPLGRPGEQAIAERQRRQLTIVCCRLTVAADHGKDADIEEVDQLLREQHAKLAERATNAGGTVATILADRIFLVFGYPQAREDDARRAARLAIEFINEIDGAGAVPGHPRVDVRIGVHTGLVIVRDLRHGAVPRLHELTGLTPNVASQLVERARSGEVLVSFDAHRLLRHEFLAEPAGECAMSELSRPFPIFRLTGMQRRAVGTESTAWGVETPLVGRGAQVQVLRDGWARTRDGRAGVAVITGEAGIGKSRLLRELRQHTANDEWIRWDCAPENQTTALRPVIDALLTMDRSVESLLTRAGLDLAENFPLFATLLSLPVDDRYPPLHLSPERQKELTLDALKRLLFQVAREQPVVLAVENVHWADPTTLELATLLITELRTARYIESTPGPKLYVIFTARPEFIPPWPSEDFTVLPLQRLMPGEVEEMVRAALATRPEVVPALVDQIIQRAEGVPLFVEEFAQVVIDSAQVEHDRTATLATPDVEIPASLRDLLTARLDGVSPAARGTAQLAAVLGREFAFDLLQAVSPKDDGLLHDDLAELGRAGLVLQRRRGRGETYLFRHALLRDAAYGSMLRPNRQSLHRQVARVLRQEFAEVDRQRPEILALHYEQGGELGSAVDYWTRAGNESYRRATYNEALTQLNHTRSLIQSLESSPENLRREVEALVAFGTALMSTRSWAVPEVEETFARAWQLSGELGGEPPMMVLYGTWAVRITRSDRRGVEALLPQLRALTARDDRMLAQFGHNCLGIAAYWDGDVVTAHRELEHALRHYTEENQRLMYDGGLYAYAYEFSTLWSLGFADRAQALRAEALAIAQRRRDPYSLAIVLGFGSMLAYNCGDFVLARDWGDRLMKLADEQRLFNWWAPGACAYGGSLLAEERTDEAIQFIRDGLERYRSCGVMCSYSYYLTYLAEAYLCAGRISEGMATVDEGLGLCQTLMTTFHKPELLRLRGELLLLRGDAAQAESHFRQALATAKSASAYALRAAISLTRLLAGCGAADATAVLEPIYAQFTEGFDTKDLREAALLLHPQGMRGIA